jgi:hypothetical protein
MDILISINYCDFYNERSVFELVERKAGASAM